jgi:hypothetical protein
LDYIGIPRYMSYSCHNYSARQSFADRCCRYQSDFLVYSIILMHF